MVCCAALATVLLAVVAQAATNENDLKALQGLKACVQANQAGKGYLNGWGATNTGPAGNAAVTAAIQQTNKALAAAGVPGVTANTGLGTPGSGSTDNDPCGNPLPWTGILCTGDRVTQVLMSQLGPKSLPCDVAKLDNLSGLSQVQNVDFRAVGLTGKLPASWSSGFSSLTSLVLAQNGLTGTLPGTWKDGFIKLQTLELDQNKLNSSLPGSWSSGFKSLINLVLGNNEFSGTVPLWSGGFGNAQLFGLSSNKLTGALPSGWQLPKLRNLELYGNNFTGCLPGTWPGSLPTLGTLLVQDNKLSGALPQSYDTWKSLNTIQITPGNSFCGTVPAALARTPDGKGQRFKIAPPGKQGDDSYHLAACTGTACSIEDDDNNDIDAQLSHFYSYSYGPAPAPAPGIFRNVPELAEAALASPAASKQTRR